VNRTAAARAHELVQSLQMSDRVQVLTKLTDPRMNRVVKMSSIIISTLPSHALTINLLTQVSGTMVVVIDLAYTRCTLLTRILPSAPNTTETC
jgi:hypothetical protein